MYEVGERKLTRGNQLRSANFGPHRLGSHYSPRDSPAKLVDSLNGQLQRAGEFYQWWLRVISATRGRFVLPLAEASLGQDLLDDVSFFDAGESLV